MLSRYTYNMKTIALLTLVTAFNFNFALVRTKNSRGLGRPDSEDPCKGLTYCTVRPNDYPEEKFKNMFKNYKVLPQPVPQQTIVLEPRLRSFDDMDNCESEVTNEPLYKVREKREDAWRTAIQVPSINFKQKIRLERCKNQGAKCFTAYPPMAEYETFCKQKYITMQVLVVKGDNGTEFIKPQLPICCSCHYRPLSFVERIGSSR